MKPLATLGVALLALPLNAQRPGKVVRQAGAAPLVHAYRVLTPPTIDGVIDEASEWKDVPSFEGLADQLTGAPSPEGAEFWLGYDSKFVYFAARLNDSQPKSIRAVEYRSNVAITSNNGNTVAFSGDDSVTLSIDLSGSLNDFSTFAINPSGATGLLIAGGRAAKREWLGEFQAKARITPTGWEAEARIPWQVLPLPGRGGKRNARFNVSRFISRLQQTYVYTYTNEGKTAMTPIWGDVEMPATAEARKLRLLPYFYAGYDKETKTIANGGVDVKAPITQTINAVGTINPDFRNIENQILSLDFSRFERLTSESRPFFLEGRNYMASNLYASQRIQNVNSGLNIYGKMDDKTSFGLVQTAYPGRESDTAVNVTQQLNANDNLRTSFTNRSQPGSDNNAYMLRGNHVRGPLSFFWRFSGSHDTDLDNGVEKVASLYYARKEWQLYAQYQAITDNFVPKLAFIPEIDFKGPQYSMTYQKNYTKGKLQGYQINSDYWDYQHYDGGFYRRDWDLNGYVAFVHGPQFNYLVDIPNFEGQKDHLYSLGVSYPNDNPYRHVNVSSDWGTQAELPYHTYRVGGSYRTMGKLDLGLTYQAVRYQGYGDQLIGTLNYDMGHDRAISGRIVKQNDKINPYIAYRRSGNAGMEYYFVIGDPNALQFRTSVILKVTYPIERILKR